MVRRVAIKERLFFESVDCFMNCFHSLFAVNPSRLAPPPQLSKNWNFDETNFCFPLIPNLHRLQPPTTTGAGKNNSATSQFFPLSKDAACLAGEKATKKQGILFLPYEGNILALVICCLHAIKDKAPPTPNIYLYGVTTISCIHVNKTHPAIKKLCFRSGILTVSLTVLSKEKSALEDLRQFNFYQMPISLNMRQS